MPGEQRSRKLEDEGEERSTETFLSSKIARLRIYTSPIFEKLECLFEKLDGLNCAECVHKLAKLINEREECVDVIDIIKYSLLLYIRKCYL